ncbi:hypothetical protein RRG08_046707 [Elysia crispata]|uniref:Uncharacterized protein n=1 Tax=Elysia crispata TaxID=231223 RepID=A0AAE1DV77_9GAST|nr:hypothetical protein RRG08_046707 [Elysia crispata]
MLSSGQSTSCEVISAQPQHSISRHAEAKYLKTSWAIYPLDGPQLISHGPGLRGPVTARSGHLLVCHAADLSAWCAGHNTTQYVITHKKRIILAKDLVELAASRAETILVVRQKSVWENDLQTLSPE